MGGATARAAVGACPADGAFAEGGARTEVPSLAPRDAGTLPTGAGAHAMDATQSPGKSRRRPMRALADRGPRTAKNGGVHTETVCTTAEIIASRTGRVYNASHMGLGRRSTAFASRPLYLALFALAFAALPSGALAQGGESCKAISQAANLESQDRFREARALLQACINAECGGDTRGQCAMALQKLNEVTPSIVVRAEDHRGHDLVDVEVRLGGETLTRSLDGMAIPVDPGEHAVEFVRAGSAPVVRKLLIARGEKFRPLDVRLAPTNAPPPRLTRAAATSSSRLAASITLLSLGAAGLGTFAWLGTSARSQEDDLEGCSPTCSDGLVDSVERRYWLANISLGAGLLALGGGTWLLLSGSSDSGAAASDPLVDVWLLPGGGYAGYRGQF